MVSGNISLVDEVMWAFTRFWGRKEGRLKVVKCTKQTGCAYQQGAKAVVW